MRRQTATHNIAGHGIVASGRCQLIEWQIHHVIASLNVDHHLARIGQHGFQCIDVKTLASHLWRFFILSEKLVKALRLTRCFCNHLLAVGFRLLFDSLRTTSGLRNNPVRIRLRLVFNALFVLSRLDHVIERFLHLRRWTGIIDVHFLHIDARGVGNQILLQALTNLDRNLGSAFGQDQAHGAFTDHVAKGTLCGVLK